MSQKYRPTNMILHKKSRILEIHFDDGSRFSLPCEYLRVYSPSAEVRGHGPGQEVLQYVKKDVGIDRIEPQGFYAVKLCFNDGHDSGIYSWETLHQLGLNYDAWWEEYLSRLDEAGRTRDPGPKEIPVVVKSPKSI